MSEDGDALARRRVTLNDVAKYADVSRALVSIVMRDVPGASPTTRERVLAAAQELGYRPDVRARSLAGQKSRLIGVMFGVDGGAFHFDLLEGLYAAAEVHGLQPDPLGPDPRPRRGDRRPSPCTTSASTPDHAGPADAASPCWPARSPSWSSAGPSIIPRSTWSAPPTSRAWPAVDHLVGLGHRDITHLDGGAHHLRHAPGRRSRRRCRDTAWVRRSGWCPAARPRWTGSGRPASWSSRATCRPRLIAYNDDTATAVMGLLAHQGIAVPADVSVIGWDDSEAAALSLVGLTSVVQQPAELARLAVERIVDRIDRRRVEAAGDRARAGSSGRDEHRAPSA